MTKTITVSLPEEYAWYLEQLNKETLIPRSRLVQLALNYLFNEKPEEWQSPMGRDVGEFAHQLYVDYLASTTAEGSKND